TGSGWICSGEAQVAELRQFPKISTYDNSATPTGDMADQQVKTAAVDRERLRAIIGDAVKQVESDDPGHLRAEIARLNSRMANWAAHEDASADAIAAADRRGYERGFWEAASQAKVAYETLKEQVRGTVRGFADSLVQNIAAETIEFTQSGSPGAPPSASPSPRPAAVPTGRAPTPAASGDGSLPGPQQRILNSLATWRRLGHVKPSNAQIAWLAGYSPSSTSYTNPRSALKTGGLIDYPMADHLALTAAGVAKAVEFKLNGSLLDFVLGNLPGPEARILTSIAHHYPRAVPNATAAEGAQYSPSSTSYTNPRSALRTKDLIDYPEKDTSAPRNGCSQRRGAPR
ncbi:hypothetical protein, partial [Bradyrhizobium japonicum]|uniref:hypothetical protein n=1 Tax=Bradyrhizobium japonicum TaxID=375 RepID=UPI0012FE33A8